MVDEQEEAPEAQDLSDEELDAASGGNIASMTPELGQG